MVYKARPLWERFMEKTEILPSGCIRWTAAMRGKYGSINEGGKGNQLYAHRVAYELFIGPIPPGLHIDHLCRNTWCVNPSHLEPVTKAENNKRKRKNQCKGGHPYVTGSYRLWRGKRICRVCERRNQIAYEQRQKAPGSKS
jgi:hypothetical protein